MNKKCRKALVGAVITTMIASGLPLSAQAAGSTFNNRDFYDTVNKKTITRVEYIAKPETLNNLISDTEKRGNDFLWIYGQKAYNYNALKALGIKDEASFKAAIGDPKLQQELPKVEISSDTAKLKTAITDATVKADKAVVGEKEGNYPQTAVDALKAAIKTAEEVVANTKATQTDVDNAVVALDKAVKTFEGSVVPAVGPTNTKPVITVVEPDGTNDGVITLTVGGEFVKPTYTVKDLEDDKASKVINVVVVGEDKVDTSKADNYVITYTATDSNGATAEVKIRVVVEKVADLDEAVEGFQAVKEEFTGDWGINVNIKEDYKDKVETVTVKGVVAKKISDTQWRARFNEKPVIENTDIVVTLKEAGVVDAIDKDHTTALRGFLEDTAIKVTIKEGITVTSVTVNGEKATLVEGETNKYKLKTTGLEIGDIVKVVVTTADGSQDLDVEVKEL